MGRFAPFIFAEEHERVVIFRGDRAHRVRGPGLVAKWPLLEHGVQVDMRPRRETLALSAVQAGNGAWLATTLRVEHIVLQPEKAARLAPPSALTAATLELVETAFREVAASLEPARMVEPADRVQLGRSVKKVANETALGWGLDIGAIEVLELREIASPVSGSEQRWRAVLDEAGVAGYDVVDVMLRETGPRPADVIEVLRRVTGWDLAHATAVSGQAPYAIMHKVRRADAGDVKRTLEAAGATVELV